ncbi:glycosyltransferase family 1 protein [Bacteroidetes/Chlorobi group bacterium Naka2016]|jgi:starch phosphorylase|nr:MAG: glycosyltransferase family 1 protein [Bacteroidetes/Chlorobi group bacterium Naka2016]
MGMKPVQSFVVTAKLPQKIAKLKELAYNYWWCWNYEAKELFIRVNNKLWDEVNHNPVLMINKLTQEELEELASQKDFVAFLDSVYENFRKYLESEGWYDNLGINKVGTIAYLSPEYGINESFPNYSGGLGVLSGDHLKTASDLALPLVGIGLLYQQGYFRQKLTQSGWQNELYIPNDFYSLPLFIQRDKNGDPLIIDLDFPEGKVYAQVWRMEIGRVHLFLLDTNIEKNTNPVYRDITDQLYGGTRETRIQQEIILGIGGIRALKAIGIEPEVLHLNEGHAAFALFERIRLLMKKFHIDFRSAKQIVIGSSVFTTHTPVPAGNEVFDQDLVKKYFTEYVKELGISIEELLSLGQINPYNTTEGFSMTVLGLKLSSYRNGVSKLHGKVARRMWHSLWKDIPEDEVPITHITSGIHTMTWVAREFAELYDRYMTPRWRIEPDNQELWDKIEMISSDELWREKQRRRVRLVLFARNYLKQRQKGFLSPEQLNKINEYLNPDALTIGFARRFAPYKRATLLFRDMDRLKAILTNPERPVQIIIAGKAHPQDTQGKEMIQTIIHKVRAYGLERYVVFLEDYDMVIARLMIKGCDVWLNTPIRPLEASGTSGMKAALNGTVNLSVLDGWWDEAFDGSNGFAIGHGEEYSNWEEQEIIESNSLYDILEQEIVPLFYERSKISRIPEKWVEFMRNSIKTVAGQFSCSRMVKEYTMRFYVPALQNYYKLTENNAQIAKELKDWKDHIRREWKGVQILDVSFKDEGEFYVGKPVKVFAKVKLGNLRPEDVVVHVYYGSLDPHGELYNTAWETLNLTAVNGDEYIYEGSYFCSGTGQQGFTIRVMPNHPLLVNPQDLFCLWANGKS